MRASFRVKLFLSVAIERIRALENAIIRWERRPLDSPRSLSQPLSEETARNEALLETNYGQLEYVVFARWK